MRPFQFQVMNELVPTNMDEKTFVTLDNDHFFIICKICKSTQTIRARARQDVWCLFNTYIQLPMFTCLYLFSYWPGGNLEKQNQIFLGLSFVNLYSKLKDLCILL